MQSLTSQPSGSSPLLQNYHQGLVLWGDRDMTSQVPSSTLGLEAGVDETQSLAKVKILYLFCTLYSNGKRSVSRDTQGPGKGGGDGESG